MTQDEENLAQDPEFLRLRALQGKLSLRFSLVVMTIFAGFVIIAVGFPGTLSDPLSEGSVLTLLIVVMFFLMVLPALIAGLFMRRMDREIEPSRAVLAKRRKS